MSTTTCPNCGAARIPGAVFCDTCGKPLRDQAPPKPAAEAQEIICPNCGAQVAVK